MSVRLRLITTSITAVLVLCAISAGAGFLVFWLVSSPFIGSRLAENLGQISARYFLIIGAVVLVLTGIGAVWVISVNIRHVAGPLQRLKKAAMEIHDGNLEYELPATGHDELSELSAAFEQMRIRLKDSVRLKEKAETERRTMMASITHDLKTPITSIMGYSEGILDGVADTPEKTLEYAAVICKKARSLQHLVDDLSLISRLENAQLPLDKQWEDIGVFAAELATEYFMDFQHITMDDLLDKNLQVFIDREKMARALVNIYQNCIKYKKPEQEEPIVRLTLARQNGDALLTVSDSGIGITRRDMPYVFDRFYRADESRNPQGGSGLGLAIARQLVQLHGGKIWIINNPEGGISVNITLPTEGHKFESLQT